jgi:hypothetical protein
MIRTEWSVLSREEVEAEAEAVEPGRGEEEVGDVRGLDAFDERDGRCKDCATARERARAEVFPGTESVLVSALRADASYVHEATSWRSFSVRREEASWEGEDSQLMNHALST